MPSHRNPRGDPEREPLSVGVQRAKALHEDSEVTRRTAKTECHRNGDNLSDDGHRESKRDHPRPMKHKHDDNPNRCESQASQRKDNEHRYSIE
jgi:hypothetical protein